MTGWALAVLVIAAPADGGTAGYVWPLDIPPAVTSSFGEFRSGRYHAGIDLRTNGIGRPVRTPLDGEIVRVRCAPTGYGKAVYIALADGRSVVFAHLDDFMPPVRDYVWAAQRATEDYTVDLYPERGQFPVKRGEIVAYSGETGAGPPHLHYELRDEAGHPINPRLLGIDWPDTDRPEIRGVALVPMGPAGRVNHDRIPVVLDVTVEGPGRYRTGPVEVAGQLGVALDVIDPANNRANVLGVHEIQTRVGGQEIFRLRNDSLAYDTLSGGRVAWHPFLPGRFLAQWRWPGNRSRPYGVTPGTGLFMAPAESTEIVIEARDFFGNSATVEVPIGPAGSPPDWAGDAVAPGAGSVTLDCYGESLIFTARFPGPESEAPVLRSDAGTAGLSPFERVAEGQYRAAFHAPKGAAIYEFEVSHPRLAAFTRRVAAATRGAAGIFDLGGVTMVSAPGSPYGTLLAMCETVSPPVASTPGVALGKAYTVWPGAMPIDAPVSLSFPLPEGYSKLARVQMYRAGGRDWRPVNSRTEGGRLIVRTDSFGTFMAHEDTQPPAISDFTITNGGTYATRRPTIRAAVSDRGSGIADIRVTANGQWLIVGYDPDTGRMSWERDHDLPAGPIDVQFTVRDRAGNITERSLRITLAAE